MGKNIPIYSLNKFEKNPEAKRLFQVEVFDKNRNFQVEYPHRHDNFYEVLFITNGSGVYKIDFREYQLKPGFVYFVSPGQVHTIDFSEDISGYIFLFTEEFYLIEKSQKNKMDHFPFFHSLTNLNPPLKLKDPATLEYLFRLACQETNDDQIPNEDLSRAFLELILQLCKKEYPDTEKARHQTKGREVIKKYKWLIEQKFNVYHHVKEYAEQLSISPNHLNETVKELTGHTAKDHIIERQLLEIKRLLSHTDLNVSEIAFKLNFQDQSYFSRFFKKYMGMSPMEFRESQINKKM